VKYLAFCLLAALFLNGCYCKAKARPEATMANENIDPSLNEAAKRADEIMKSHGLRLELFEREMREDSTFYYFEYNLRNKKAFGGGGKITLSKCNLKIIDEEFSQ